ncbi:MAG: GTP pyrophosphokinase family protein [Lachnospiraceae bacterium]|nr:GTP pyrophosphokinase family protein [Ruminococcus sp.]MCM1275258.1 GTP pyrophosphokinase family protein [Lachnospiraceae bacterium]
MNINKTRKMIENPPSELEPVRRILPENAQQQIMEQMFRFIELEHLYESAIREVKTKLEILDSEFRTKFSYNPIHHIEDRLKSPQSIMEKLQRKGAPVSVDSARANLNDIAGVRVICNYIDDIYTVADLLTAQDDVALISRKDYITDPKPNGYRSLHLVIETPVYLSDKKEHVHVEVQIRTIAMDFWASLEHELKYKTDTEVSSELAGQLKDCAETIAATDKKMQQIYKTLKEID